MIPTLPTSTMTTKLPRIPPPSPPQPDEEGQEEEQEYVQSQVKLPGLVIKYPLLTRLISTTPRLQPSTSTQDEDGDQMEGRDEGDKVEWAVLTCWVCQSQPVLLVRGTDSDLSLQLTLGQRVWINKKLMVLNSNEEDDGGLGRVVSPVFGLILPHPQSLLTHPPSTWTPLSPASTSASTLAMMESTRVELQKRIHEWMQKEREEMDRCVAEYRRELSAQLDRERERVEKQREALWKLVQMNCGDHKRDTSGSRRGEEKENVEPVAVVLPSTSVPRARQISLTQIVQQTQSSPPPSKPSQVTLMRKEGDHDDDVFWLDDVELGGMPAVPGLTTGRQANAAKYGDAIPFQQQQPEQQSGGDEEEEEMSQFGTSLPIAIPKSMSGSVPIIPATTTSTAVATTTPAATSTRQSSQYQGARTYASRGDGFIAPHILSQQTYQEMDPLSVFGSLPPSSNRRRHS